MVRQFCSQGCSLLNNRAIIFLLSLLLGGSLMVALQVSLVVAARASDVDRNVAVDAQSQQPSLISVCPPDIQYGETIRCSIDLPSEIDRYTFSGAADDMVYVRLSANGGLWSGVRIDDFQGDPAPGCEGRGTVSTEFTCTLNATGVHRLVVYDAFNGALTGTYHLYLQRINKTPANAIPIRFGQTLTGAIDFPSEAVVYSFDARGGSRANVRMSARGGLWAGIRLLNSAGTSPQPGCEATGTSFAEIQDCMLPVTDTYRILTFDSFNRTLTGTYHLTLDCRNPNPPCPPFTPTALVLIYAVLDNNLGDDPENWERLVNNAEAGVHDGVTVRLMIDGPGADDAYVYNLEHDEDPGCPTLSNYTCHGRYEEGRNLQRWREDTAHPYSVRDFITQILSTHPYTTSVSLALVGHGGGWSANALPGQPSRWVPQPGPPEQEERVGGMLWDDNPGGAAKARSLSTRALGDALAQSEASAGRAIDLLYLDACSMGMAEVAYEVRNNAHYLLASPNTDWASFAYDAMLGQISVDMSAQAIGSAWLAAEAEVLRTHQDPFIMTLYDLQQMNALVNAASTLGNALTLTLPAKHAEIRQAFIQAERYESNYDGALQTDDTYVDLESFGQSLTQQLTDDDMVINAVQSLQAALAQVVLAQERENGRPWPYPEQLWQWSSAKGLSIYLPLAVDEPKRALYTETNLQWAQDSTWDEFLDEYWRQPAAQATGPDGAADGELPTCDNTRTCDVIPQQIPVEPPIPVGSQMIFLPIVSR